MSAQWLHKVEIAIAVDIALGETEMTADQNQARLPVVNERVS